MAARLPRLMRRAALLVALAAIGAAGAADAQGLGDPVAGRQVIRAEALRRAGLVRVGDLLALANRWDLATVDGITWQAAPNGLAALEEGRWTVLVDGQPLDLGVLGMMNLHRSAVSLVTIDSVEFVDAPSVEARALMLGGVLHIHTARPRAGVSAAGWFTTGSEIGDPGPFAFTPRSSANVDRLGHEYAARVSYGAARWWADASVNGIEYPPTDPALFGRYVTAAVGDGRIEAVAPAVRFGARLLGHEPVLTYRASRLDNLFALPPAVNPVATIERFSYLGLTGAWSIGPARHLRYGITRNLNRADARKPDVPLLHWRAVTWNTGVEMESDAGNLVGARVRHITAVGTVTATTVYGQARPLIWQGVRPTLLGAVTLAGGQLGIAAAANHRWTMASRVDMRASVGVTRQSPSENTGVWAWAERGFSYFQEGENEVAVDGRIGYRDEVAADVMAGTRLDRGARIWAGVQWRALDGLALLQQELHYAPAVESFAGPAAVSVANHGQVVGAEIGASLGGSQPVRADAVYRVRRAVSGSTAFRESWSTMPDHIARMTATYAPVPGFALQAMGNYRSASHWADYRLVEMEASGQYLATIPASLAVDLTAQKQLGNGRMRVLVGVQNVTGTPLRYHPAGATRSPALVMQVDARLP